MSNLIENLINKKISDIYRIGVAQVCYSEVELINNNFIVFVEFEDSCYLRIEAISQSSRLEISCSNDVFFGLVPETEDLPPYKISIIKEVLLDEDSEDCYLYACTTHGDTQNKSEKIICDAFSLHIKTGEELFFDPTFYWGVNLGGQKQKERWLESAHDS